MTLSRESVNEHSQRAFEQWKELWTENALLNRDKIVTSHKDFLKTVRA